MIWNKLKHNDTPHLDPAAADQMLQNVFNVCGNESNTVPLQILEDHGDYRKQRFTLQKIVLIVIIILLCTLPFDFIAPTFAVIENTQDLYRPVYEIQMDSIMPVEEVTATLNGDIVPVSSTPDGTFSITPDTNGDLRVTVTLRNLQYTTHSVRVTTVDTTDPTVQVSYVADTDICLQVEDDGAGVDYEAIVATDETGMPVYPLSYDCQEGRVVFQYPETVLNVCIPDMSGNELHLILTPRLVSDQ